jgi:hypothetical protein
MDPSFHRQTLNLFTDYEVQYTVLYCTGQDRRITTGDGTRQSSSRRQAFSAFALRDEVVVNPATPPNPPTRPTKNEGEKINQHGRRASCPPVHRVVSCRVLTFRDVR